MEGLQLNIWSVLIILGAIQGLVLAFGFLVKGKPKPNRYFAFFILAISIHLIEYAIDISGLVLKIPHVFTASYPFLFLMGPFFYFYTRALFNPEFSLPKKDWLHFLPALGVLLMFMPFYLQSTEEKLAFFHTLGAQDSIDIPTSQFIFMFCHVTQMLIYAVLSFKILRKKEERLQQVSASTAIKQFSWIKKLTHGFIYYLGLYLISLVILISTDFHPVEVDFVILLLTSISIYLIGYKAIRQPILFQNLNLNGGRNTKNLEASSQNAIKEQIESYFQTQKPYLNENLKLDDVAEALDTPAHHISEVINECFGKNFFEFTNGYRIEEAKKILVHPDYKDLKILAVAFDSGFGNKATFNRVFKKSTGLTPSEFRVSQTI